MLPQHLNLSWTATRADVVLLTTLNSCDTKPVLPARWLCTANHYMPFHDTFHYEMSNHPTPFFNQIVHFPAWMHGSFPSDFTHQKVNVYDNIDAFVFQCLDLSVDTLLLYWSCGAAALQIHPSVSCHHLPCTQCVRALESIPAVFGAKVGFLSGQWTSGIRWSGGLNVMFNQPLPFHSFSLGFYFKEQCQWTEAKPPLHAIEQSRITSRRYDRYNVGSTATLLKVTKPCATVCL